MSANGGPASTRPLAQAPWPPCCSAGGGGCGCALSLLGSVPHPCSAGGGGCAVLLLVTHCPPAGPPDLGSLGYEELVRRNVVRAYG